MTSRKTRVGFVRRGLIVGAAAALLAAAGARAEDGQAGTTKPEGRRAFATAHVNGGTGSSAVGNGPEGRRDVSPVTGTKPVHPDAAPAAQDRGRNDYDEARELAAGNSGGRG